LAHRDLAYGAFKELWLERGGRDGPVVAAGERLGHRYVHDATWLMLTPIWPTEAFE
jgi:hypothetical protein